MKLPSEQNHVAAVLADEKRITAESDRLVAAMRDQEKSQLKKLAEIQARLARPREQRTRLVREYAEVRATAEAEERTRLEASNVTDGDLKEGRADAATFIARHLEPAEIDRRAKEAAEARVQSVLKAARSAALDVLRLEAEEADVMNEVEYCRSSPLQAVVERLKAQLKSAEAKGGLAFGGFAVAMRRRDDLRRRLGIAAGGDRPDLGGMELFDLTIGDLEALRFDPIITDAALPELLEIIGQVRAAGPDARLSVFVIKHDGTFGTKLIKKGISDD
jgi:hypothetical protein